MPGNISFFGAIQMSSITVIKQDSGGKEVWRYTGSLLKRTSHVIVLEAYFDHQDIMLHGMPRRRNDRFVETYFTDRWYNLFEIHDGQMGNLRGWYINISHPAVFEGDKISYKDLALDVLIFPDGRQIVLDEDEFQALDLLLDVREKALAALAEIQSGIWHDELGNGSARL